MGIKDFSHYKHTGKSLFRVYKKLNGKQYQEYFKDESEASARLNELDAQSIKPGTFEHFLLNEDVREQLTHSNNIGCRFTTLHITQKKKNRPNDKHRVEIKVQAIKGKRSVYRSFSLNQLGWPQALYDAVDFATECYEAMYPDSLTDFDKQCIFDWSRSTDVEEAVVEVIWKNISEIGPQEFTFATDLTINQRPRFITLRQIRSGTAEIKINCKVMGLLQNKYVKDYDSLYGYLAYYTYRVIKHLSTPEAQNRYMLTVYFMLVTQWIDDAKSWNLDINFVTGDYDTFVNRVFSFFSESDDS